MGFGAWGWRFGAWSLGVGVRVSGFGNNIEEIIILERKKQSSSHSL
ncbi:MAG: hypothetical protein WC313_07480 [Candidatus Kapaibacterium sp.]